MLGNGGLQPSLAQWRLLNWHRRVFRGRRDGASDDRRHSVLEDKVLARGQSKRLRFALFILF